MHFPLARCTIQKKSSAFCQGGQTFWYEEELFLCCRRQLTIFSWPRPSKLTYNIVHNSQSQGTQKLNCRLITRFHHHFTPRAFKALHWLALLFFSKGQFVRFFRFYIALVVKKLSDFHMYKRRLDNLTSTYNLTLGKNNKNKQ